MSIAGNSSHRLGAIPRPDGTVEFRLWAPTPGRVELRIGGGTYALSPEGDGVLAAALRARVGDDYTYVLDGARELADPCSRCQPDDRVQPHYWELRV